ncbi:MAG: RHS repeat protein, partial [Deltaproteobacteria bacterium]|nr:RHS repeat protein [Deltaproteobacteria bacterium]
DLLLPRRSDNTWTVWIADAEGEFSEHELPGAPYWSFGAARPRALAAMDVDGDGLHDPIFWDFSAGQFWDIHRHRGEQPDRIHTIVDGLGQRVEIEYRSITDYEWPDLHEPGTCVFPSDCSNRPRIVVERHRLDTGLAEPGMRTFRHEYAGTRTDRLEGRWLGFSRHDEFELAEHEGELIEISKRSVYFGNLPGHYDEALRAYPLAGRPTLIVEQRRDLEFGLRQASMTSLQYEVLPTSERSYRALADFTHARTWEFSGGCFQAFCEVDELKAIEPLTEQTHHVYTRDELGFPVHERTTFAGEAIDTQRSVVHDPDTWLVGLVKKEITTSIRDGETLARTAIFTYDLDTGALVTTLDEPDDPELFLATGILRDAFGNAIEVMMLDSQGNVRGGSVDYDTRGRYPITQTNALGHVTTLLWHEGLDAPAGVVDPNGVRHVLDVDGFSRTTGMRAFAGLIPRGDDGSIAYLPSQDPALGGMRIRTEAAGHGTRETVYDRLARPVRTYWVGPEGKERYADIGYDERGRVTATSLPAFLGEPPAGADQWIYDGFDRPILHHFPDGNFERWIYDGLETEHRDAAGERDWTRLDPAGRLLESRRAMGTVDEERLCFDHGHFSDLVAVRPDCVQFGQDAFAPAGQAPARIKRFEYDRLGRVMLADDPSRGLRVYEYNAFGELLAELDANEQLIEFEYDALGRLISSTDDAGETTWTWDTKKIGELTSTESSSGVATSYEYDAFTRRTKIAQTIDGETLALRLVYGDFDRITGVIYPGNPLTGPITLRNFFGADGSLVEVRDAKNDALLWKLEQLDAAGNLERERFGNQLITERQWDPLSGRLVHLRTTGQQSPLQDLRYGWNPVGTLTEREDLRLHQREQFGYDHLHRLTDVVVDVGLKHHERQFSYDSLGNLVHASDIGDYDYDHRGRLQLADATQHVWDDNGNLIYRAGPAGTHRFEWTSADKLHRLIPADAEPTEYRYDAEDRRVHRIDYERELETVYLHGFYERDRETKDDGVHETHRYTVFGRERAIAEIVVELSPDQIGAKQTRYLHDDHLGSIDLVTDEQAPRSSDSPTTHGENPATRTTGAPPTSSCPSCWSTAATPATKAATTPDWSTWAAASTTRASAEWSTPIPSWSTRSARKAGIATPTCSTTRSRSRTRAAIRRRTEARRSSVPRMIPGSSILASRCSTTSSPTRRPCTRRR